MTVWQRCKTWFKGWLWQGGPGEVESTARDSAPSVQLSANPSQQSILDQAKQHETYGAITDVESQISIADSTSLDEAFLGNARADKRLQCHQAANNIATAMAMASAGSAATSGWVLRAFDLTLGENLPPYTDLGLALALAICSAAIQAAIVINNRCQDWPLNYNPLKQWLTTQQKDNVYIVPPFFYAAVIAGKFVDFIFNVNSAFNPNTTPNTSKNFAIASLFMFAVISILAGVSNWSVSRLSTEQALSWYHHVLMGSMVLFTAASTANSVPYMMDLVVGGIPNVTQNGNQTFDAFANKYVTGASIPVFLAMLGFGFAIYSSKRMVNLVRNVLGFFGGIYLLLMLTSLTNDLAFNGTTDNGATLHPELWYPDLVIMAGLLVKFAVETFGDCCQTKSNCFGTAKSGVRATTTVTDKDDDVEADGTPEPAAAKLKKPCNQNEIKK